MALQEQEVREQLKKVIDPELFVNIVDLGLIYVVDVITRDESTEEEPKYDIKIEMTMTSPMCPAGPQLVADSKSASMEIMDNNDVAEIVLGYLTLRSYQW